jgi:PST family polysaccharide transporter
MSDTRILAVNTSSLFFIQIANYILPVVLIPYLTHTLGLETFGIVAFGLAYIGFAVMVTDFGFDLYGPHVIAKQRGDNKFIKEFVGSVFICKMILLVPVILVTVLFSVTTRQFHDHSFFLLLLIIPIIGQTFQPVWFYQGIERMTIITYLYLGNRILYVVMVLSLVKHAGDYTWVIISHGIAHLVGALLGFAILVCSGYGPKMPDRETLVRNFRGSSEYFYSRAAVAAYTTGGTLYLGFITNPAQVALYSAAEQLYKAAQGLYGPLVQALYPFMSRKGDIKIFKRILVWSIVSTLLGGLVGIFAGRPILRLIFGPAFNASYGLFLVFLVILCVNVPSVLLGYPLLGAMGHARFVNKNVIVAGIIQVCMLAFLYCMGWARAGTVVVTVLVAETAVLLLRVYKVRQCSLLKETVPTSSPG